jgi:glycine cleavage system aminomethyltransferase T
VLGRFADGDAISDANFPFGAAREIEVALPGGAKVPVWALRISYVGELGWELYLDNDPAAGLALYDALLEAGAVPVGIETYATSRRLEKSFRVQGIDLETEYDAYESAMARPAIKKEDFIGKAAYLEQRGREPAALLCTLSLDSVRAGGDMDRYPVGIAPILDPASGECLVDARGRRSYTTSTSYCPSLGQHLFMGYLPAERARVGEKLRVEYFDEGGDGQYPVTVTVAGRGALYDPEGQRVRG